MLLACRCLLLLAERTFRDGEPDEERWRKRMILPIFAAMGSAGVVATVSSVINHASPQAVVCACAMSAAAWNGAVAYALLTRRFPQELCEAALAVQAAAVLLCDWGFFASPGTGNARAWPFQVCVVDALLVARARGAVTQAVVGATLVWLVVTATAAVSQWGLMDVDFVRVPPEDAHHLWSSPALRVEPRRKPATFAALNRVGFLPAAEAATLDEVAGWIAADTEPRPHTHRVAAMRGAAHTRAAPNDTKRRSG
eukprot:gene27369-50319_t